MNKQPKAIEIYPGGGGLSSGLHRAGFNILLGAEWDKHAREMYKKNFPDVNCINLDMFQTTGADLMRLANIKPGELDLLCGGPPCQGFSSAGKREVYDERNNLLMRFVDLIAEIKPRVALIENVSGLTKGEMIERFIEFSAKMNSLEDYNWELKQMNSLHYGTPSDRLRNVFIAVRKDVADEITFPEPDTNIEHLKIGNVAPQIKYVCYGYGFKKLKRFDAYCNTITKTVNLRVIDQNNVKRKLTVPELLKFAGFPEDWQVLDSYDETWARIGNAVSPPLAYALAKHIRDKYLDGKTEHKRKHLPLHQGV